MESEAERIAAENVLLETAVKKLIAASGTVLYNGNVPGITPRAYATSAIESLATAMIKRSERTLRTGSKSSGKSKKRFKSRKTRT